MTQAFGDSLTESTLALRRLVPAELERALSTLQRARLAPTALLGDAPSRLLVNLSAVGWVEIGAVAQLVVLIDGWARQKYDIGVSLPTAGTLSSDRPESDRQRRQGAQRFLRYLRFNSAIAEVARRRGIHIRVEQDGSEVPSISHDEDFPETYRRVVPLHWIKLADVASRKQVAAHMTQALRNSGDGVDGPDAEALSNVVLHELIENVVEHSQAGEAALVCGFAHSKAIVGAEDDFLPEELPYLLATDLTEQPLLEVIVGDSGRGIVETLSSSYKRGPGQIEGNLTKKRQTIAAKVIRWAFDRWSTEKEPSARRRGVRGLFRVDRLAAKYFGQLTVRTGETFFVREHLVNAPPIERHSSAPHKFARLNGTLIRIRLTSVPLPGIAEVMSRYRPGDRAKPSEALVGVGAPAIVTVEKLLKTGLPPATEDQIVGLLAHEQTRPSAVFVVLASPASGDRSIELSLKFLASHGSPVPLYATNIRCSLDELDTIATSINAECDRTAPGSDGAASQAEQLDLVLAAHESGAIRWIGVASKIADLLRNVRPGEAIPVSLELYPEVLKAEARLKTFFVIEMSGTSAPFRKLRCIADFAPFNTSITSAFRAVLTGDVAHKRAAIWRDSGPYLTPTLNFVRNWVRVDLLIDSLPVSTFQALVFELARTLTDSYGNQSSGHMTPRGLFLAVEERSSLQMGDALAARFGFHRLSLSANAQSPMSTGHARDIAVIVYADLVSSGESLRRAAQNVLRRGQSVAAVVALVDTRANAGSHIEAFGQSIPLITLIHQPNEVVTPARFGVVAPSLLDEEMRSVDKPTLMKLTSPAQQAKPYIRGSLDFRHRVKTSGRHLTLTISPDRLLSHAGFSEALQAEIENSTLYSDHSAGDLGPIVVLTPLDEQDEDWRKSVERVFALVMLRAPISVEFVARAPVGKTVAVASLDHLAVKIRKASLVVVFDWGVITGRTIDALTTSALENGSKRVLVLVANSQLTRSEARFRDSVRTLQTPPLVVSPGADLLESPKTECIAVDYRFIALSTLPLGQYWEADCPVCTQATDLMTISCTDPFIAGYRESSLRRLQHPDPEADGGRLPHEVTESIAGLRALLVASQTATAPRFALRQRLSEYAEAGSRGSSVLAINIALVELLYVEGNWIQQPPLRYRSCRGPVSKICLHTIKNGSPDQRAKAISVLRRVSKSGFMKRAPEVFDFLPNQSRALGALLFGIHTYIARRYHETVTMLEPAIVALEKLRSKVVADSRLPTPVYSEVFDSVQYLAFQAEFLRSRATSRKLGRVEALRQLKFLLSEPNYFAHGVQNQAIERLLAVQFLDLVRARLIAEKSGGIQSAEMPKRFEELLQLRVEAWADVHKFLTTKIIPLAAVARKEFESKYFRDHLGQSDAQWFLNLLDLHESGLAPEMNPGVLLQQLQGRGSDSKTGLSAAKTLDLLDASIADLTRLLNIVLRAEQQPQLKNQSRPAVKPSLLKEFLDHLDSNVHKSMLDASKELRSKSQIVVRIELAPDTQEADFTACCPQSLLREVTLELLTNVAKHGRASVQEAVHADIRLWLTDDTVHVEVRNHYSKGTHPLDDPQRHGIALFRKDLAGFGAALETIEASSLFTVHMTMQRWR